MARILLVEDNEMNRDMLSRRLIRGGHEVVFAMDGQRGVDLARSEKPDVILMDMSLPVEVKPSPILQCANAGKWTHKRHARL